MRRQKRTESFKSANAEKTKPEPGIAPDLLDAAARNNFQLVYESLVVRLL
ncbi:hypothetical protein ACX0G7_18470 [Flavitalea antarctica]